MGNVGSAQALRRQFTQESVHSAMAYELKHSRDHMSGLSSWRKCASARCRRQMSNCGRLESIRVSTRLHWCRTRRCKEHGATECYQVPGYFGRGQNFVFRLTNSVWNWAPEDEHSILVFRIQLVCRVLPTSNETERKTGLISGTARLAMPWRIRFGALHAAKTLQGR